MQFRIRLARVFAAFACWMYRSTSRLSAVLFSWKYACASGARASAAAKSAGTGISRDARSGRNATPTGSPVSAPDALRIAPFRKKRYPSPAAGSSDVRVVCPATVATTGSARPLQRPSRAQISSGTLTQRRIPTR